MPSVVFATCAELPNGDEDAVGLSAGLARLGLDSRWAVWTDDHAQWDGSLVVLRSTWDYASHRGAFLSWVNAQDLIANDAAIVTWNTDKTYLADLRAAGLPVVPTSMAAPGTPIDVPDTEFVVKPSVGAGSRGIGRFTPERAEAARRHAEALQADGHTVLVQPYLAGVDTEGETSLVYLDGVFSHAIEKGPMLPADTTHSMRMAELYVGEHIEARTPTARELEVGVGVTDYLRTRFGRDPLYCRVDLLPSPAGPVLVEVELTEPSLFLGYADSRNGNAGDRFATAIAARI